MSKKNDEIASVCNVVSEDDEIVDGEEPNVENGAAESGSSDVSADGTEGNE